MGSNHERQLDELTVLEAMFGEHLTDMERAEGQVSFALCAPEAEAVLRVRLPPAYPAQAALLELSCPGAAAAALELACTELGAIAAAASSGEGGDGEGEECCATLAQRFIDLAADELKPLPAAALAPGATAGDETLEEAVVLIDHMNDHEAYLRLLERWAGEEGLDGAVLYTGGGGGGGGSGGGGRGGGGGAARRVHGVTVVLQGGGRGVASFLQRLRTELVDVDSRGRRCRERQSTVLCRRPHGAHVAGYPPAVRLDGWVVRRYTRPEERDHLLDAMRLLHVGTGATRFGAVQAA